eukprot:CAMPEP_0115386326 /NCGR_PEP_ID=MMETSP0271-20121206/8083_1 /TAXON_ID=71861 /ORGANISM="Scrippsiella trochoidea, Strain CCMP3099" /LENGTH=236 /DNA_ID=CAMNT_0002809743 /DNA_START=183 /DNA_END=895 /DNA_ORIENTATION=+
MTWLAFPTPAKPLLLVALGQNREGRLEDSNGQVRREGNLQDFQVVGLLDLSDCMELPGLAITAENQIPRLQVLCWDVSVSRELHTLLVTSINFMACASGEGTITWWLGGDVVHEMGVANAKLNDGVRLILFNTTTVISVVPSAAITFDPRVKQLPYVKTPGSGRWNNADDMIQSSSLDKMVLSGSHDNSTGTRQDTGVSSSHTSESSVPSSSASSALSSSLSASSSSLSSPASDSA